MKHKKLKRIDKEFVKFISKRMMVSKEEAQAIVRQNRDNPAYYQHWKTGRYLFTGKSQ